MDKIKKLKRKYLPNYALKAMILALAVNFIGYNGVKFLIPYLKLKDFSFGFEESIPFLPIFIYIYLGAFAQWIIGYLRVARQEKSFVFHAGIKPINHFLKDIVLNALKQKPLVTCVL